MSQQGMFHPKLKASIGHIFWIEKGTQGDHDFTKTQAKFMIVILVTHKACKTKKQFRRILCLNFANNQLSVLLSYISAIQKDVYLRVRKLTISIEVEQLQFWRLGSNDYGIKGQVINPVLDSQTSYFCLLHSIIGMQVANHLYNNKRNHFP